MWVCQGKHAYVFDKTPNPHSFHIHSHAWMDAQTHILFHSLYFPLLAHHSAFKGTYTHELGLVPAKDGVYAACSVWGAKRPRCDLQATFQPPNLVCNRLSTTTVWFHHAWPGTREQLLDEKLWQLSLSGHRPSQWEVTAGNVIATLSYYSNARTENTKWIACPQWLLSYRSGRLNLYPIILFMLLNTFVAQVTESLNVAYRHGSTWITKNGIIVPLQGRTCGFFPLGLLHWLEAS